MRYELLIAGRVSDTIRAAFPDFSFADGPVGGTVVHGPVRDRDELRELLARLDDLGLTVLEMRQRPD